MKLVQSTSTIMMVRPIDFSFNWETAASNAFQKTNHNITKETIKEQATKEFDDFVQILKDNKIQVILFEDTLTPSTPDSIFPNNWISLDQQGRLALYPMQALNRRQERRLDIIEYFEKNYQVKYKYDFSYFENNHVFLEGTGSMVIDYVNNIMYACLSPRTNPNVINTFCEKMNYTPFTFLAVDEAGKEIYHTNVMMCIGEKLVIICLESIKNIDEQNAIKNSINKSNHTIVNITYEQMNHFAGNMLEVCNSDGKRFLVMSAQAKDSLTTEQINTIEQHNIILSPSIPTIETIGGGGVRCMMAEVFLETQ